MTEKDEPQQTPTVLYGQQGRSRRPVTLWPDGSIRVGLREEPGRRLRALQLGTGETAILTPQTAYAGVSLWLCNTDTVSRTVTIYHYASGDAAAADVALLSGYSIPANTTVILGGLGLAPGDTLSGLASSASVLTATLYDKTGSPPGLQTATVTDHGSLSGLSDDDHSIYALLAGRSGGQTLTGGTGASDPLTFDSTSNATKGTIKLGSAGAGSHVQIGGGTSASELRLYEASGSGTNYTGFKAQAMTGNPVYTLPAADGSANTPLVTNGAATLAWSAITLVQGSAVTSALTTITHTSPGTPDYAVQDLTQTTPFGFVTKDEGNTVLSVIANLQARVNEIEDYLQARGMLP